MILAIDRVISLIEALTISFHYPLIPGTTIPTPQMTVADGLSALGLAEPGAESQNSALPSRPSATAATAPALRLRTIGEVKRMIRALLRSLNTSCERLEEIPGESQSRFQDVR